MPYADIPGVQLYYEDSGGSGAPAILLHAASGNTEAWAYQVPAFAAAGLRCITYDRRGWGRSKRVEGGPVRAASEDLSALMEHLGLRQAHLVGTAAGAAPALEYALSHRERVRSLVLSDCGAGASAEPAYEEMRRNYRPKAIDDLPVECRELSAGYRATSPAGVRRWLEIERNSRHEDPADAPAPARLSVTFNVLKTLTVPTLMVCGQADLVTPPALMRLSQPHIPGCRLELVQEAGHAAHWEQPDIWNEIVLGFLRQS